MTGGLSNLGLVRGIFESIFALPSGFLADRLPRPALIFMGSVVWGAGLIGCAFAPEMGMGWMACAGHVSMAEGWPFFGDGNIWEHDPKMSQVGETSSLRCTWKFRGEGAMENLWERKINDARAPMMSLVMSGHLLETFKQKGSCLWIMMLEVSS